MYEAQIYYTCKKENVGAEIELSFDGSKTQGTVTEAHNPPLVGEAENKVYMQESFMKDFKPMTLGKLTLAEKQGLLTLRATKIPGSEAVDVRYVVLTRID